MQIAIKYEQHHSQPHTAVLTIDLKKYSSLSAEWEKNQQDLIKLKEDELNNQQDIIRKKEVLTNIKNTLQHNRNMSELELAILWKNIKEILLESETKLYKNYYNNKELPLVIDCLEDSFGELLKNSIDAFLKKILEKKSTDTLLKIYVALKAEGDNLFATYVDNGGGFSEEYLNQIRNDIHNKTYKEPYNSEKLQKPYYLGGAGKGIIFLLNRLLEGISLITPEYNMKHYKNVAGNTSIEFSNDVETKGAKIILSSPIKPFERIEEFEVLNLTPTQEEQSFNIHQFFLPNHNRLNLVVEDNKSLEIQRLNN